MTRSDHKTADRYISKVLHSTSCPKRARSELRKRLTAQITAFAEGKESITEYMLCMEFGEPQDVAASAFDREEYRVFLKKERKKTLNLARAFVIIVALTGLIYTAVYFIARWDIHGSYEYHYYDYSVKYKHELNPEHNAETPAEVFK